MILLRNIIKEYSNKECKTFALKGIDLCIKEGELLGIVGTSGSGKTTLLNILGGMDKATSGEYYYYNELISNYSNKELQCFRRDYISFIFQNFELMDDYNVYENVEMPLLARNIDRKIRKERIHRALMTVGLDKCLKKMPNELSGGQKQRCAIARALVAETPVLLADEPTGALDQKNSEMIMDYLIKLNNSGKTIVVITHDNDIAARCGRVVHIEDGMIVS